MRKEILKSAFHTGWSFILFVTIAIGIGGSLTAGTGSPRNHAELRDRVKELRIQYAPYLRSLPEPLTLRSRSIIDAAWLSQYEVERAGDSNRSAAPAWFREDFDDTTWVKTQVPEWRYRASSHRNPESCILWYRTKFEAAPMKPGQRVFLVFEGVDWEAEVWLNGKLLGSHKVYYEPFRFDVTSVLKKNNTLAVRVIDGPKYGEPAGYWSLFPLVPAEQQRYVREKSKSIIGYKNGDLHIGSGYGIHRAVYLETVGKAYITDIFVHSDIGKSQCSITTHFHSTEATDLTLDIKLMPENFDGKSFEISVPCKAVSGENNVPTAVQMSNAKRWTPDTPYLYRCRVTLKNGRKKIDSYDVLFGYRSFSMVSEKNPKEGLPPGMFLLNDQPIFLRGTNIQGMNALWYWGENDKLMDLMLMLKAANFNAVRSCQHVQYPEVRELQDRLGIMSQQDQGSRFPKLGEQTKPHLIEAAGVLARICYNNPGVVLLSYANETNFDPTAMLEATLKTDPDRIVKPISGTRGSEDELWPNVIEDELWANVIDDFHTYKGWYGSSKGQIEKLCRPLQRARMVTVGEYGAEALDAYETMATHYPLHWEPTPAKDADTLWGQVQTEKTDIRQIVGFRGKKPSNLGEYIQASQNYQADMLSETTKSWRISPRSIAGYFQFHYVDVIPANWPKSIVSHDLAPKRGYYEMAQINQPLVPLPRIVDQGNAMQLWIANDLNQSFDQCRIRWVVRQGDKTVAQGERPVDVPAHDALLAHRISLPAAGPEADVANVSLTLLNSKGAVLSRYERDVFLGAWRKKDKQK